MLCRLYFLLYCICFSYNKFLFSFLHFILCRMCVCHMFNKVLTYLLHKLILLANFKRLVVSEGGSVRGGNAQGEGELSGLLPSRLTMQHAGSR